MHQILSASAAYGPVLKQAPGILAVGTIILIAVVCHFKEEFYVEYPTGEPWVNVLSLIQSLEASHGVVFDLTDEDLWEYGDGGVRLHGMAKESMVM